MLHMTHAHFSLTYDGDSLRDGEIDVVELAPALLALAQSVKATGKIILGPDADVNLKIRTMRDGSFEVLMNAVTSGEVGLVWSIVKSFYADENVQTAKAVVETIIDVGAIAGLPVGLIKFLLWRRNRVIDKEERRVDGTVKITIDGIELLLRPGVIEAARDSAIRAGLEKAIVGPLDRDGINSVKFSESGNVILIKKEDRDFLRSEIDVNSEFSYTYQKVFSIVTLSFKASNKWKLNDGQGTRNVTISDQDFVDKIDKGLIRFAKGDLLVCQVKEDSLRIDGTFKSQYEIVKVIEHIPYTPQEKLDL